MSNICYHFQLNQVLCNQSEHYHQLFILEFSVYKKIFPHYVSVFQSRVESVNVFAVIVFFFASTFFKHSKYLNDTIKAYIIQNKFYFLRQKKISFVQIMYLKLTFLTPGDIKNYYQQPTNYQRGQWHQLSQLKLQPSLFELKDIKTIDTSTIIKKWQDMSRNVRF